MNEEQVAEVSDAQEYASGEVAQSVEAGLGENWRDAIPEEIRGHKSLSHINDIGALAKSYVHAQSMIGADKVAIPGKHATPEDWGEVYSRLGRPMDANGYDLPDIEGLEPDSGMVDWFKQTAHSIGLNPAQASALYQSYNEVIADAMHSREIDNNAYVEEVEATLRREFGQAFDDKIALGSGVVAEFGSEDLASIQLADGTMLGNHPDIIRMVANIGTYLRERVGEDTLEGVKMNGGLTPEQARDKVSELTAQGSPYWNNSHPEHEWYVQEAMKFREAMVGGS